MFEIKSSDITSTITKQMSSFSSQCIVGLTVETGSDSTANDNVTIQREIMTATITMTNGSFSEYELNPISENDEVENDTTALKD